MIGALPVALEVSGKEYPIRSDYRNVLQVFEAFEDPELEPVDKWIIAIFNIFSDFECEEDVLQAVENGFDVNEASERITWFISAGSMTGKEKKFPLYNWTQDEQMIFSAVNKVYGGGEVRNEEYMHWWTFLGYFNEVGEGTFSFIVGIRDKLNKGKKLEKHEQEFYYKNRDLVDIHSPLTEEEQREEDEYNALLYEVLG